MRNFLFSATDRQDRKVTDNIAAETLSQAKYALELRGFTAIEFLDSELSTDVIDTFSEHVRKNAKKNPEIREIFLYDTSATTYFKVILKKTAISWIAILGLLVWTRSTFSFALFGFSIASVIYLSLPKFFYGNVIDSVFMANHRNARFWIAVTRAFNFISIAKIPNSELDMRLACLDAQAGNIEAALARIAKYSNHPKVSRRVYFGYLYSLHCWAKRYDDALKYLAESIKEGNDFPEELLDHATTLAHRKGETTKAREFIERVLDREANVLITALTPLTQGIIEVQDRNFAQAEFYLREAQRRMGPFSRNQYLIGPQSHLNAFLSIVLKAKGEMDEASRLFRLARPYLEAHRETELLARSSPGY